MKTKLVKENNVLYEIDLECMEKMSRQLGGELRKEMKKVNMNKINTVTIKKEP